MKRLSTILLTLLAGGVLTLNAAGITIHVRNQNAEKAFASIMRQSGKNFIYKAGLLKGIRVSVDADDLPLSTVLDRMLKGTGVTWRERGGNILLSAEKRTTSAAKPVARRSTISGFVREADSEEALAGVIVAASDGTRTVTNAMGFYSMTIPCGSVQLAVTYPGFEPASSETMLLERPLRKDFFMQPSASMLQEIEVVASPNRTMAVESTGIGSMNLSRQAIKATPVIFGESDVIKTLQLEPGVSPGIEGMAGMYVHGGNSDENLYMLDNIPLYQVNHLGGLFSAFNTEALRNVDFHKSTFPAKYDGRLSSFVDINTKDGSMEAHHGSVRLGLTSGAFNIDGPIWKGHTSYSVAVRRSWYDVLTIPICAIASAAMKDETYSAGYAFTDVNAKVTHRFSDRSHAFLSAYYGEDYLRVKQEMDKNRDEGSYDILSHNLRWGNIVASAGWNYIFSPKIFGQLSASYTRYFSSLKSMDEYGENSEPRFTRDEISSHNNINDWIFKADFDWQPHPAHRLNFGAGYTLHSFLPSRSHRVLTTESTIAEGFDNMQTYRAGELNAYFGGDWQPFAPLRISYGAHYSLFRITGKTHQNISPRVSLRWTPAPGWAVKGGYSRTVQYVHQLFQSSISLPTDQWVPIIGNQKPQTADKFSVAVSHILPSGYTFSIEGYWKRMSNLLEYMDEYYLLPPSTQWDARLTAGKGESKGIDFKVSKDFGALTGHIAYSLLWADRQYDGLNGGRPFPARFDNRHKINVMLDWKINTRWEVSAAWTGMSGNRITLPTQVWNDPTLAPWHYDMYLQTEVNNFRLPFYHRLDLSARRNTRRGYWTFSLYNAYCNMNTIAVRLDYSNHSQYNPTTGSFVLRPAYQKIKLIPIIPSVSYTWLF